jgi:mannosyltransferase
VTQGRQTSRVRRESIAALAVVVIPAAVAVGLCLYDISARNLWLDEAASVSIASQHGGALGAALAHDGGNMLGYYALLHVLIGWFGSGSLVIRIPSALGAGATVALLAMLGLRLFGRRTALLAGLLGAVSLSMIYWGQNARAYTLMLALICGSVLSFVWLVESPRGAWRPWVVYVIVTTAALYAGLEAVLVIPAQLLILAWHRPRVRPVVGAVVAVAVCCVPLAVLALSRGSGQLFWVPSPSYKTLRQVVQSLGSAGLEPNFYTPTGRWLLFLTLALTLAAAVRVGYGLRPGADRRRAWQSTLVLGWLVLPLAITAVISELSQSIFQARYLLVSLPAVALLLGWLLDGIWQSAGGPVSVKLLGRPLAGPAVAAALLATLLSLRALQLSPSYGKSTEPWRAASQFVVDRARPGDCLAFYPLDVRMPFRYYLRPDAPAPTPVLPSLPLSRVRPFIEQYVVPPAPSLASAVSGCSRVWLVSSHGGEADGPPVSRANYSRYFVLLGRLERRYPSLSSASFGYAGIISVTLLSA